MHIRTITLGVSIGLALVACNGGGHPDAADGSSDALDVAMDVALDGSVDSDAAVGDPLGTPCTPTGPLDPATCAPGLYCSPAISGFCTRDCARDSDCPSNGVCVDSARSGQLCIPRCAMDSDCPDGACDLAWHACAPPGYASPHAPICAHAAPAARTTFGPTQPVTTATSPGVWQFEPAAALTADGTLVVAYTGGTIFGLHNAIGTAHIGLDGVVHDHGALTDTRESHFDPWMASDATGRVHLVRMGFNNTDRPSVHMQIAHSASTDGITWTPTVGIEDVAHDCPGDASDCLDKPMIAIGPDDTHAGSEALYTLYTSDPAGGMRAVRSHDDGASWSTSTAVGPGTYGDARVGSDGVVHVLFVGEGSTAPGSRFGSAANRVVYFASTDGGATFHLVSAASATGESIPFFFSNPQLAVDDTRHLLYAVYAAGTPDGARDIRLGTSSDAGVTWTHTTVNDDGHCASHMVPMIAVDPMTGTVHVVWDEARDGTGRVAYAHCDTGGAHCSVNEAVSDAPFASYHLVRQSPSWLGEYNALVLDATRRRLHLVWTQTVDVGGVPTARIFHSVAML